MSENKISVSKPETSPYLAAFRARAAEPGWLATGRGDALAHFGKLGFPTRREEAWRFTDLRLLQRQEFLPADAGAPATLDDIAPWRFDGATHRLVLVDGHFAPGLSDIGALPSGVWLASTARTLAERPDLLAEVIEESDKVGAQSFASLNAAFFADGFVLALDEGAALDHPVEVLHLSRAATPASHHLRSLIRTGASSRATVIESFAGTGSYWTNEVALVRVGAEADLVHVKLQDEGLAALHFGVTRATLAASARYRNFNLTLGALLARQDIFAHLAGEKAQCGLDGAYLLRGDRESTVATFVDHAAPGGATRELYKGVVEDQAHGVFLGRIAVRPDAQQTDAHQLNRNLLLSRRASVDTKPELEIFADDVKCSHGATIGDLDETALFYLLSRGIPDAEARQMLVEAFAAETLDRVEDAAVREYLGRHLTRWLAGRSAS